jgi:pimeloyl-ACP methyl ester carboxylesterase
MVMMAQSDLAEYPRFQVDALGIETSYYETGQGNGRSVVLLHGMTSSGDAYREMMAALDDSYHLIAPDIPGFGYSSMTMPYTMAHLVEWLAAFLEALDLRSCYLVGHSFGGVLATYFTHAYPEDVARLALIAPALLSTQRMPDLVMKAGVSLGLVDLGTTISQSRLVVPYQVKSAFYQPEDQPDSVWERRLRDYENARASASVMKVIARNGVVSNLDKITQPVCLIWGEEDLVVPISDGVELAEMFPQAELHPVADCGHVPVQEKTAVVIETIALFLGEG